MFAEEKYRTFGRRFWAGIIDGLVLSPLTLVDTAATLTHQPKWILVSWAIVSVCAYPAYSILMHGFFGRTVGKRVMHVVVLDVSEQRRLSFSQAFLRDLGLVFFSSLHLVNLVRTIIVYGVFDDNSYMPTWMRAFIGLGGLIWYSIELLTALLNDTQRAIHDRIAGTVVVDEGAVPLRIMKRLFGDSKTGSVSILG